MSQCILRCRPSPGDSWRASCWEWHGRTRRKSAAFSSGPHLGDSILSGRAAAQVGGRVGADIRKVDGGVTRGVEKTKISVRFFQQQGHVGKCRTRCPKEQQQRKPENSLYLSPFWQSKRGLVPTRASGLVPAVISGSSLDGQIFLFGSKGDGVKALDV